jgi:hypothetical protein
MAHIDDSGQPIVRKWSGEDEESFGVVWIQTSNISCPCITNAEVKSNGYTEIICLCPPRQPTHESGLRYSPPEICKRTDPTTKLDQ